MSEADEADALMARVAAIRAARPEISPLGAAILAAADLDIARDSRSFAKSFGIEHALVLREIASLEAAALLSVERRDARTMRTWISVVPSARN